MMLSNVHQASTVLAATFERVTLDVRRKGQLLQQIPMFQSELLIGRGQCCDLQLDDRQVDVVHAEIRQQAGVIWIEAVDESRPLTINNHSYSRLALRHGDAIHIGEQEIIVRIENAVELPVLTAPEQVEDLSALSADELCDRILAEEALIAEDEDCQLRAWGELIYALDSLLTTNDPSPVIPSPITSAMIQERERVQEVLAERRNLGEQSMAAEFEPSPERRYQRLEELMQQLHDGEYRASA